MKKNPLYLADKRMMLRASQKFQRITDERELLDELGNELVELLY